MKKEAKLFKDLPFNSYCFWVSFLTQTVNEEFCLWEENSTFGDGS